MRKKLLSLLFALIVLLSACGNKSGTTTSSPAPIKEISGEYIAFYLTTKDNLNPIFADTENDIAVYSLLYDSLIYLENDMSISPQLAKSCTVSSDSTSISFLLRDDVFWHDGEKFTADDVKHTIEQIKASNGESIYFDSVTAISEINVLDDYNFTLNLTGPYARIVNLLDFPIIPSHCGTISEIPVGTGKYQFSEKTSADVMTLSKNNLWKLGDLPIEENVNIKLLGKSTDNFSLFKTGEVDVLNVTASQMNEFGFTDKSIYFSYITPKYEFIGFNLSNRVFSDANVRKAISLAINRDEIATDAYLGLASIVNAPIPPNSYFYNSDADDINYSANKAAELLSSSGWVDSDGDGIREKNIENTVYKLEGSLLVNDDNPLRLSAAEKICSMLSQVGIKVYAKPASWTDYQDMIFNDDYSLFFGGIELSPSYDYSFLLSSWAIENGQNFMNYSSEDMDKAISKTHTAVSMDECKAAYLEFQYVFARDLPVVGLLFQHNCLMYQNDISGVLEPVFSKPLKDINRWQRGE